MSGVIIYLGRLSPIASSDQPETSGPHTFPFGLASDGVYRDPCCYQQSGGLLHHLSTLTDGKSRSGIFLLHFPWSHLHRTLSGILPCEARTFLTPAMLGRDHLFYLSPQLLLIIMCFPQNVKAILYIEAGTADEFADNRILADTVARHRKEIIQKLEQALCLQIFRTILVNGKQQRLGIHL